MWERHRPGRIVVGVDGSLGSLEALRQAVHCARAAGHPLELEVVRVWRPTVCSYTRADFSITNPDVARYQRQCLHESLTRALGGRPDDIEIHTHVRAWEGNSGKILTWFADGDDDLLIIGSSRNKRFSGLSRGSVGRYCVRHARCALLVVPLPEFAKAIGHIPWWYGRRMVRALTASPGS